MTLLYPLDASLEPEARLQLLGTKASGLHEMTALGIPVPPGFTLTTEVGAAYRRDDAWPDGLQAAVDAAVGAIEEQLQRGFGDADQPLLVSVRSGAPVSMPGMMDTLLNVGLNDETLEGLARAHGDERFALDAYRRLLQMYGTVVRGIGADRFQTLLGDLKTDLGHPRMLDSELPVSALQELIGSYLSVIEKGADPFPQDVKRQLWDAAAAVFDSWDNARAVRYRRMQRIDDAPGTACTVQAMVFGNTGSRSGSGVAFTRNPSNGDKELYGEFLPNAQGEDVVAGIRTPVALTAKASAPGREGDSLERSVPEAFEAISDYCAALERHFGDMQDIEFTVEDGSPYLLQTRTAKRTARAAVRVAVDMVREGVLTKRDALLRVDARSLEQLLQARLPRTAELSAQGIEPLAVGLPASPGAASGRIVFDADDAVRWVAEGQDVILVRQETSADDIHGMRVAKGVVTATGGMTSHAAVVARGLGKCCVVGCGGLDINLRERTVRIDDANAMAQPLREGDLLTLDGSTGNVYTGALDVMASTTVDELEELMTWADRARRMRVYAEADTPHAARAALSYGAEGVGLCRTEHMFFAQDRLFAMRCALLALDSEQRARWLAELERVQRDDFVEFFEAMDGRPVTIRLLDRTLEEFMPREESAIEALAEELGLEPHEIRKSAVRNGESNPAFGHRGVRSGLTVPGLYDMQLRAMLFAARDCVERGLAVELEVLVPMVAFATEVEAVCQILHAVEKQVFSEPQHLFTCRVGTMIELPRACLAAEEIARLTEVFSFGGNDLTQAALGISREDASRFLPKYLDELGLLGHDPFTHLDDRVAELIRIALERAKAVRPTLVAGLCGDQGGHPGSIEICEELGLDFVSCPLPQLPGARLAAAQARLRRLDNPTQPFSPC
ncbi:MAG: pyruvate, phosphate dikinase [Myxococcales bacterium]|nr:pyruvate, phosphate dikinase [Myxococcales bacterium]